MLKTHRPKQQTYTTYTTPIIPTHPHNSTLPPKYTLNTNKHKHQYQTQIINKNNQKRARPSDLAQNTTTNIRTRQIRTHNHYITEVNQSPNISKVNQTHSKITHHNKHKTKTTNLPK